MSKYNDQIRVIISKARLLVRNNDYLAAEELYFSILDIAKQADLPIEVTERYRSELLNLYVRVGAVELAISEYERIMAQKPSIKLSEQCSYLLSLSNSYKRNFDYIKAAELLFECREMEDLSPEDPRYVLQIAIYRSLSDLARLNEQPVERRKWAELAFNESKLGGRVDFNTYLTLTQVYREQGLQDSLALLFSKMEEIPERLVQLPSRLQYIKEKAHYLNSQQRVQEAIELLSIMITVHEDDDHIYSALRNGAVGYLNKNTNPQVLIESIKIAVDGGSPMSPNIARKVIQNFQQDNKVVQLTEQELIILEALAEGLSYKMVAKKIFLSVDGVRYHIRNIYSKLDAKNRADAISKAYVKNIFRRSE